MTRYEFPYRIHRGIPLPLIPIILAEKEQTYALLDSGANVSLFEAWVAERVGLPIEKGKKRFLTGIGGRILAYEHLIPVRIVDYKFSLKIAFSRELDVSVNLLGQDNFFDHFVVSFDRAQKVIQLTTLK